MSTVDDAIEAGARAAHAYEGDPWLCWEDYPGEVRAALAAAWPVLSAPMRELHEPANERFCPDCGWDTEPAGIEYDPCPTVQELDRIDRELGIETDNQSGDPS